MRWRPIVFALTASVTGCYLPVSYMERASPPLWGTFRHEDGTPVAGGWIAVSSKRDDTRCRSASSRTITDVNGRFQLRATFIRRTGVWLIPAFEHFSNSYLLCAAAGDSVFQPAYYGSTSLDDRAPGDSIECLKWVWNSRTHISCSIAREKTILEGGHWSDEEAGGYYRLILTEEGPLKGPDGNFMRPRVVIQWVQRTTEAGRDSVRSIMALPSGKKFASLTSLKDLSLHQQGERWCVSVISDRWTYVAPGEEWLTYELGPPGHVKENSPCLALKPLTGTRRP